MKKQPRLHFIMPIKIFRPVRTGFSLLILLQLTNPLWAQTRQPAAAADANPNLDLNQIAFPGMTVVQAGDGEVIPPFTADIRLSLGYDSNLFSSAEDAESDFFLETALPLALTTATGQQSESEATLTYTPTYTAYNEFSDEDNLEHDLLAYLRYVLPKTITEVSAFATQSQGSDRFISGLIEKTEYGGALGFEHELTGKSNLEADLDARRSDYESKDLLDQDVVQAEFAFLYGLSSKTSVGPYAGLDKVEIDGGDSHTGVSAGVRVKYDVTGKTLLSLGVGYENRSYSGDVDDTSDVEFRFELLTQLTGKSVLIANLYREVRGSYTAAGEAYDATGAALALQHVASQKLSFDAGFTFENDAYFQTRSGTTVPPDLNYYTLDGGVTYEVTDQVGLFADVVFKRSESDDERRDVESVTTHLGIHASF